MTASTVASNVTYATFAAQIQAPISGVHDIFVKPSAAVRVNWYAFGAGA